MGKKTVQVASSASNLGGDINDRPQILQQVIISSVLSHTPNSIGEVLRESYLHGTGMKLRSFYKWASKPGGYSSIVGGTSSQLTVGGNIDGTIVEPFIPRSSSQTITVTDVSVNDDVISAIGLLHVKTNYLSQIDTDWRVAYSSTTGQFTITFVDNSTAQFTYPSFTLDTNYLSAYYTIISKDVHVSTTAGIVTYLAPTDSFPVVPATWTTVTEAAPTASTVTPQQYWTATKVWSDGRPDTITTGTNNLTSISYLQVANEYKLETFLGQTVGQTESREQIEHWYHQNTPDVLLDSSSTIVGGTVSEGGGVTSVTTTVSQDENITITKKHFINVEIRIVLLVQPDNNVFLYEENTGHAELDALFTITSSDGGGYFPYIPLRIDNQSIKANATIYSWCVKAYKRLFGINHFEKTLKKVESHEKIGDMDYAYIVTGCSLNTSDESSLEYIYRLFKRYQEITGDSIDEYLTWQAAHNNVLEGSATAILNAFANKINGTGFSQLAFPRATQRSITVGSNGNPVMNFNMVVEWSAIEEQTGIGLAKPNAKTGDLWIGAPPTIGRLGSNYGYTITWQTSPTAWKSLSITGLYHRNKVYEGHNVNITRRAALLDPRESGFIIPLHYGIFREMSLVRATQLGVSCKYMVINAYEVHIQSYWKMFVKALVAAIIITAIGMATGFIGAGSAGMFGSAGAVGGAMGASGLTAVFIGSVVNLTVASLAMQLVVTPLLVAILGEKWAAILMPIIMLAMPAMFGGGGMDMTMLFRPENLLKLTDAAITSYGNYQQFKIQDINKETKEMMDRAAMESKKLSDKYANEFGKGKTDLQMAKRMMAETAEEFFLRTQMTGSDIVETSKLFLNADVMRKVPLNPQT